MITYFGLALGALFITLPLYVAYVYKVSFISKILSSFCKMLVRVLLMGVVAYFLIKTGRIMLDILFAIALVVYSSLTVTVKVKLSALHFFVPVSAGILVSSLLVGSLLVFANVSIGPGFGERYVLPVFAILSGGVVDAMAKSIEVYYMGLRYHNHLYYYMLGNGVSRSDALDYLMKRAMEKALIPGIRKMSGVAVGASPVVMWTMITCGMSVFDATAWQVLLVLALYASSVLSVWISLIVVRKYMVDSYSRIKCQPQDEEENNQTKEEIDEQII